jgi:hypothetical protein
VTDEELRQQFRDTGVLRFDGAFTTDEAAAMRDAIWSYVERKCDVRADDPTTWPVGRHIGISFKSMRRGAHFGPLLGNPAVSHALDVVFGGRDEWKHPNEPKAQILLSFPTGAPWTLPNGWHMDTGFQQPTWPVFAVKAFAFFGDVEPEGGGTFVLEGSHRLVERYSRTLPPGGIGGNSVEWGRFMKQDPWLDLLRRGGTADVPRRELVGSCHEVDGIPLRCVELTGKPGDLVLTHLHVFHSASDNATTTPRQMLGVGINAASPPPAS